MRLTISNCRSGTDSTFTLKPFSSRYLAYSSQHPHCRGLYMVAVFASSAAAAETAKSAPKVAVRTNADFKVGLLVHFSVVCQATRLPPILPASRCSGIDRTEGV